MCMTFHRNIEMFPVISLHDLNKQAYDYNISDGHINVVFPLRIELFR